MPPPYLSNSRLSDHVLVLRAFFFFEFPTTFPTPPIRIPFLARAEVARACESRLWWFPAGRCTIQYFINDVPQGFAFTNVKFDATHYKAAVCMEGLNAQVQLIGELSRPKSKRPANSPWFQNVLNTESLVGCFINRDQVLQEKFVKRVSVRTFP